MFRDRATSTGMALAMGLGLLLALLWALSGRFPIAHAQGPGGHSTYYVAPSCSGVADPCYTTVQAAVDAADDPEDVIKVAAGTYTDVSMRLHSDVTTTSTVAQVVYIDKTVAIRGGYTTAFTDPPDPDANPTTLDAGEQGRVIYITGDISPTLEGLRMINGLAHDGGGIYIANAHAVISGCQVFGNTVYDDGAGLYLHYSDATLTGNTVTGNTALNNGGGLYLHHSDAALTGNTFTANIANSGGGMYLSHSDNATLAANNLTDNNYYGGLYLHYSDARLTGNTISHNDGRGLYLYYSDAILISNTISSNVVNGVGGGLYLYRSDARLISNIISSNVVTGSRPRGGGLYLSESAAMLSRNNVCSNTAGSGGGLYLHLSDAALNGNTVCSNTASSSGGGLYLDHSDATLNGNTVCSNTARSSAGGLLLSFSDATLSRNSISANTATAAWSGHGGGLYLSHSDVTLDNNFVTDNILSRGHGSGLYVRTSSPQLYHNTIARNQGGGGEGLYVTDTGKPSWPRLHNTVLVSHQVGIHVDGNSSAQLEGTLWSANGIDWVGDVATGTINVWGDPGFVDPDGGDYHINADSAAVDAGAYPTLEDDVDGEPRPAAFGPDIGADERPGPGLQLDKWASHDTRNPGQTITYTLRITGVGAGPVDNVILMDTLPPQQRVVASATSVGTCAGPDASVWGGQVSCTLDTLNVGDHAHITITAQVSTTLPPALPWLMRNGAWVTGTQAASFAYVDVYMHDCHVRLNDGATEWDSVQAALDASTDPTDVAKVAGVCTGVNGRGGARQVAYISKTITIQGGYSYSPANWSTPDPDANPTTLDAMGQGRVIYITRDISPTLGGLRMANGLTSDEGGGIYAAYAHPVISGCQIFSNTAAEYGGGLYLYRSDITLNGNTVFDNTAYGGGGGLHLYYSDNAVLSENIVTANIAYDGGGGLYLWSSDNATFRGNSVSENTADNSGGGLYLYSSDNATFRGNSVSENTTDNSGGGLYLRYSENGTFNDNAIAANTAADDGGGLYLWSSDAVLSFNAFTTNTAYDDGGGVYLYGSAMLDGNTVSGNAAEGGGGVYLYGSAMLDGNTVSGNAAEDGGGLYLYASDAVLTNTVVADNRSNAQGSGLYIRCSSPRLLHSTIARNSGGDGSGVHVTNHYANYSTVALTNTILVSHAVGITVSAGNTATLECTLWGTDTWANGTDWGGNGTVMTGTCNLWGDPDFVDPDVGDYHIGFASAAIDEGVDAGVTVDIDGQPRPARAGYDIGADELPPCIYLPLVLRQPP